MKTKILGSIGIILLLVSIAFAATTYTHTETNEPSGIECYDDSGFRYCQQITRNQEIIDSWTEKDNQLTDRTLYFGAWITAHQNNILVENNTESSMDEEIHYINPSKKTTLNANKHYVNNKYWNPENPIYEKINLSFISIEKDGVLFFLSTSFVNSSYELNQNSFIDISGVGSYESADPKLSKMIEFDMALFNKIINEAKISKRLPDKKLESFVWYISLKYTIYLKFMT